MEKINKLKSRKSPERDSLWVCIATKWFDKLMMAILIIVTLGVLIDSFL